MIVSDTANNSYKASHYACLLNDNCDGTFTLVSDAKLQDGQRHSTPVRSKTPLPRNAPPIMDPRPPARWASAEQEQLFAASQKQVRSRPTLNSSTERTVDEMISLFSGCVDPATAETSGSTKSTKLSSTTSPQDIEGCSSEPEASLSEDSIPPTRTESEDENTNSVLGFDQRKNSIALPHLRDATQENWRLVKDFLTGIQFYPSRRGHFATLLSTPRARDIVTRPGMNFVADQPKKVHLLIAHLTGPEPPVACSACAQGRGPFEKCVTISQKAASEITNGVVCCTNCAGKRNSQRSCNLGGIPSKQLVGRIDSQLKQPEEPCAAEPEEKASLGTNTEVSEIEVDSRFKRTVHPLPRDASLGLNAESSDVRLCSATMGKVLVELEGNSPFLMGPHGMFTLLPTMSAQVSNASEADAVLVVYTVKR